MERPESVVLGTDSEVLTELLTTYPKINLIVDTTSNSRKMWKNVKHQKKIFFFDIDPQMKPNVVADFHRLPLSSSSVDLLVWDPPHLPSAAGSNCSDPGMIRNYGLRKTVAGDNISSIYQSFLIEALRVLKPDGLIFVKLKDFVHNHKYQWSLVDFINIVNQTSGLTACDLRVKRDPCGGNLKSSKWKTVYHARNTHCWWIIVRKGKCEPKN